MNPNLKPDACVEPEETDTKPLERFRKSHQAFAYVPPRRSYRLRDIVVQAPILEPQRDAIQLREERAKSALEPLPTVRIKRSRSADTSEPVNVPKKRRLRRTYTPPEVYKDLQNLTDCLEPDLDIIMCGINPGKKSAIQGHHYAAKNNHFWRAVHLAGLTDELLEASEDASVAKRYNWGLTDLVERPTCEEAELSSEEKLAGGPVLLQKCITYQPRIVCFVGKCIAQAFEKSLLQYGLIPEQARLIKDRQPWRASAVAPLSKDDEDSVFHIRITDKTKSVTHTGTKFRHRCQKSTDDGFEWDLQGYKLVHSCESSLVKETLFFAMTSTSGLVTSHQLPHKAALMKLCKFRAEQCKAGKIDTSGMIQIQYPPTTLSP